MNCRTVLVAALWLVATGGFPGTARAERSGPPNVIVILIDDLGWRDVGFMGNRFVETPHLDRLARRGMVFSQAYASAPNCAPTRACLLSGQSPPRHGIYTVVDPRHAPGSPAHRLIAAESRSELATEVVTIAEALQAGGYATGFFGMWNLGRGRKGPVTPGGQGFERVIFPESLGFAKDAYVDRDERYLSDRLTDEVLAFVEQNRAGPFFVYLADHAVHAPFQPRPDLLRKYERKVALRRDGRDDPEYAATIEAVDQNVGRLVDALARQGLTDNTLILFTSDNGGTQRFNAPLRGGKGELYEGGLRVPLVIAGAGVRTSGVECEVPVSSIDLYPTLLEVAGLSPSPGQPLDGVSLVPLLQGARAIDRQRLFWHFPCYVGRSTPSSAVREGDEKLIEFFEEGGRRELYNLRDDPSESRNLAAERPDRVAALYRTLQQWQQETGAAIPTRLNPDFDPRQQRGRRGGGSEPRRQGQPRRTPPAP